MTRFNCALGTAFAVITIFGFILPIALSAQADDPLVGTQWQLIEQGGSAVEAFVTLNFAEQGNVGGNGGCNVYGGSYSLDGDAITFEGIFSTMMACPELDVEQAFFNALSSATTFTLSGDRLIIRYGDADEQLVFVPAPTLQGPQWQLIAIDGTPAVDGALVTLTFNADGSANGDSGCNLYRTTYTVDGSSLTFSPALSTRRACPSEELAAQETALLQGLEAATGYTLRPEQLVIRTEGGQQLEFAARDPLAGTAWTLSTIDGAAPLTDTTITLEFSADGRVAGSDGCNRYSGPYSLRGGLRFGENFMSTLRACPPEVMRQASAYLAALTGATGYRLADDELTIAQGADGTLVFSRQG